MLGGKHYLTIREHEHPINFKKGGEGSLSKLSPDCIVIFNRQTPEKSSLVTLCRKGIMHVSLNVKLFLWKNALSCQVFTIINGGPACCECIENPTLLVLYHVPLCFWRGRLCFCFCLSKSQPKENQLAESSSLEQGDGLPKWMWASLCLPFLSLSLSFCLSACNYWNTGDTLNCWAAVNEATY